MNRFMGSPEALYDPLCTTCLYALATPLQHQDCEKCKSLLEEVPNKPGYYYFNVDKLKDN